MSLPDGFLRAPVAHRGLHDRAQGRVENSRAAVEAAARAGYAIEIDVQLSADGEAMVFHDANLDRLTTARGPVRALGAAELGGIALRDSGGETVPTLSEILAIVGGRVPLVVEIKDQGGALSAVGTGPLEARVGALLADHAGPVAAMSFNPFAMAALRNAAPAVARGLVACAAEGFVEEGVAPARAAALAALEDYERVGACFLSYEAAALPAPRVAELRAAGAGVLCWTIRGPEAARRAAPHVDAITFEGFLPQPDRPSGC